MSIYEAIVPFESRLNWNRIKLIAMFSVLTMWVSMLYLGLVIGLGQLISAAAYEPPIVVPGIVMIFMVTANIYIGFQLMVELINHIDRYENA